MLVILGYTIVKKYIRSNVTIFLVEHLIMFIIQSVVYFYNRENPIQKFIKRGDPEIYKKGGGGSTQKKKVDSRLKNARDIQMSLKMPNPFLSSTTFT